MKVDHICVGTLEIQSTTSRCRLDAGDTDSVDPTPENHRMNRKQTANDYKSGYKVPQLLFLTGQNLSKVILIVILQHVLDFGCRITHTGC